jgi:hypothetical protein
VTKCYVLPKASRPLLKNCSRLTAKFVSAVSIMTAIRSYIATNVIPVFIWPATVSHKYPRRINITATAVDIRENKKYAKLCVNSASKPVFLSNNSRDTSTTSLVSFSSI